MNIEVESGIQFDFAHAVAYNRHDRANTVWPGVDFIVDAGLEFIWLEVKNWEPSGLAPRRRGGQRSSFLAKMRSNIYFREELRSKFLGTTAYLAFTGMSPAKPVTYVVLLESPRFDSALKLRANDRMRQLLRTYQAWTPVIRVVVLDLPEWNLRYSMYPATAI